ncbi:unnamed protein product [Closterium sp. Yama58-4]|nr:unnamed protein product [Closterium sp. Yama58-4]
MLLAEAIRYNLRVGARDQDSRVQWEEPTGYCQRYRNATQLVKLVNNKCCWTVHACVDLGFSVRISFIRDYYLNSTEDVNDFLMDRSFKETWMDEIVPMNVSIVVLNRGAHYRHNLRFERQLRPTLLALRNANPEMLMIVRNTPPGHLNCSLHEKPLFEKLLDLPDGKCWHWNKFAEQNMIVKKLTEGVGGVYMDVNASAVWRPDGHVDRKDCLHYCHPGPVDTWVQLLFNMLQGLLVPTG